MLDRLLVTTYLAFMTIAFYATTEYRGNLPRIPVNLRYVMDVMVLFLALIKGLVTADIKGLDFAARVSVIWLVPLVGIEVISMIIWIVQCPETGFIVRGSINIFCAVLNVLCMAAAYYLFGSDSVKYTFIAAVVPVAAVFMDVIRRFGAGQVLREYADLMMTFADSTGKAMEQMELHDLVQGLGMFAMYFLFCIRHERRYVLYLAAAAFFFSLGLKRIDVMGIAAASAIGLLYGRMPDRMKPAVWITVVGAIVVFAYSYLILIRKDLYQPMMESLGIDTMSRDHIYAFYKDFYEISPRYLGNGVRYIFKLWSDYRATGRGPAVQDMPHNEFMTYYIELGFWGFLFWLWSNTWFRIAFLRKHFGSEAAGFLIMAVIYTFLTYATDNTFFYYSINIVMYITVTAYADRCRSQEAPCGQ